MAWTSLSFAYGSTLTSAKMTQLYDNLTAVAYAQSGAPRVTPPTVVAGTDYTSPTPFTSYGWSGSGNFYSNTVASGVLSYTEVANYRILQAGTYRVSFSLRCDTAFWSYARIYVNGVATGTARSVNGVTPTTYTEDITLSQGDTLQIYAYTNNTGSYALVGDISFGITKATEFQLSPVTPAYLGERA